MAEDALPSADNSQAYLFRPLIPHSLFPLHLQDPAQSREVQPTYFTLTTPMLVFDYVVLSRNDFSLPLLPLPSLLM